MKHPTREEWIAFVYGEVPADAKSQMQTHLDECGECRAAVEVWTRASRRLDDWKLPARSKRRSFAPALKLAAAAGIVALAIVGGTRIWRLNNEVSQLRVELRREIADRNTALAQISDQAAKAASMEAQALVTEFATAFEEKRAEDQRLVLATLQQLETKHAQDFTGLRKDLETVAVLTEAGFRQAQNEIANIAYSPESK